jgi:hypothetical protein
MNESDEAPRSKLWGILSGIAPKLVSPFYWAEALGEGRSSLHSRDGGTEYPGEGE